MKILGIDENKGLIVHLTKDEIANLMGFAYAYCSGFNADNLRPGAVMNVSHIYAEASAALDQHKVAIDSAKRLQSASTKFLSFFKEEEKGAKQ